MTIITKQVSAKKSNKSASRLLDIPSNVNPPPSDVEAQSPNNVRMVFIPARVRRISPTTTICLLITALIVVGIGIVGGSFLYQQYIRSQFQFKGWCAIPISDNSKAAMLVSQNGVLNTDSDEFKNEILSMYDNISDIFQEEVEMDLEKDSFERINVPDFRDGRNGRFIHDFNANTTGIIDVTGRRCFVMPLDRDVVLPPRSLKDLFNKVWGGYYKVNTDIVRETMHVITPPLNSDEVKDVGVYIMNECKGLPIYKLEKYVSGVVKRSAELDSEAKFANFAGTRIMEFDIVNLDDVKAFESNLVA